ncbi:MAG TPA: hypothetical protein VGG30_00195 [Pirellulales bacterium]|jgi:predicted RNase H-like HicB family nuclease
MLTYKAMYKAVPGGMHAEVLDFPGAISFGADLDAARQMLSGALVDLAETTLMAGHPLPVPNPESTDPEADLEEPIHLLLSASAKVAVVAEPVRS